MPRRSNKSPTVVAEAIEPLIRIIRGQKIILDSDLARIYGVETKVLNQAVKRNAERFPSDFLFQLSSTESEAMVRSRSHFVTLKRGYNLKYRPHALHRQLITDNSQFPSESRHL